MKHILVKMPTKSRPEKAVSTLKSWIKKQRGPKVRYVITLDTDDTTMDDKVIEDLYNLRNAPSNVIPMFGQSESKIHACNRDIKKYTEYFPEWDIIILISDDMVCQMDNWDNIIRQKFEEHFPDGDGCLWFKDGSPNDRICTLSIIGRKYFDRFGYIYHPDYKSFRCDDEFTILAKKANKIVFIPELLAVHDHPYWTKQPMDELYTENQKHASYDEDVFQRRQAAGFPPLETA